MFKVQNIDLMLKKSHTQKYMFSKYKFFRIGVLHVRYLIHVFNFFKIYILFRTCISLPIHCYFSLKPIHISKIVCYLKKTVRKMSFVLGRSTERSSLLYYRPSRSAAVTSRFPKYVETESRRRSAMHVRQKNTSRIRTKPKVT